MHSDPAEKQEFYRKLEAFHLNRDTEMVKLPILGRQEMDLCWLYKQGKRLSWAHALGGADCCVNKDKPLT